MNTPSEPRTSFSQDQSLQKYVSSFGGKRVIKKILIANNGIAAVKAIRSIRRWAYETFGDERTIEFVSMATPEDVTANAEYVRMADMWTSVPGGSNNRNFANVDLICDLADRFSCHAVWAGWGHASENPALPAKLIELGITFLGPGPASMHALGDKIASTIIAQSAGVPTVAWSGTGLSVDYRSKGTVDDQVYQKACVLSADHVSRVAQECGYPLVVKASEGGGGKGIRVVRDEVAISTAYRQVASEVPGSPIFLMKLVEDARHLEVQIVADEHGDALALYGRDCSVQRRHQKIIEEGPVVAAPPKVWKRLESAAVALAKEVGYVGAGTVEYLYKGDEQNGEFFFLELNPRLQVEHPVTEWITGVNLPALQLHIGMGIPLRNVSTIRKFLRLPDPVSPPSLVSLVGPHPECRPASVESDDAAAKQADSGNGTEKDVDISPPHGHVIACRVTAENPDEGFQPTSGGIQELTFRNTPNVWGYFSVGASGGVHEYADSQFGHLFAWGETRESSRRSLVLALKELSIRGDIRTTVEYLIKLLEMKDFRENRISTSWLDSLIARKVAAERPPRDLAVVIGAVCRAHMDFYQSVEKFTQSLERGQVPLTDSSIVSFPVELLYEDVKYRFFVTRSDESAFRVRMQKDTTNGRSVLAELRTLADDAKLVVLNGRSHVCYAREEPAGLRILIDGQTCLFPKEYDPTTLTCSVSGKLVRFLVNDGDHVEKGQSYVELEVMKMYLTLSAPESGHITVKGAEGSPVDVGDVIALLKLDDPSKVRRAELFNGDLPNFSEPQTAGSKPHQIFKTALREVQLLLRGFDARRNAIHDFLNLVDDVRVCAGEIREALSSLSGRIPSHTANEVEKELRQMLRHGGITEPLPVDSRSRTNGWFSSRPAAVASDKALWSKHVKAVMPAMTNILKICQALPEASELCAVVSKYAQGSVFASSISQLLDEYLGIEKHFARRSGGTADSLLAMRENTSDLRSIAEIAASHLRLKQKNEALLEFLNALIAPVAKSVLAEDNAETAEFKARLHQMCQLYRPEYNDIALKARMILADLRRPHFHHRRSAIGDALERIVGAQPPKRNEEIQRLVGLGESILDVLVSFMIPSSGHEVSSASRQIATQVQLLRSYRAYEVCDLEVSEHESSASPLIATWKFRFLTKASEESLLTSHSTGDFGNATFSRGMTSFDSADNLVQAPTESSDMDEEAFRHGILAVFTNWSAMEKEFDSVLEEKSQYISKASSREVNAMTVVLRWDHTAPKDASNETHGRRTQFESEDTRFSGYRADDLFPPEAGVSKSLAEFCRQKRTRQETATKAGIKTITFIVAPATSSESVTYPGFYTFRVRNGFLEDPIFRHIDPPMAFQLELSRLSNFSITRFGYPNRSVHVFYAEDKMTIRKTSLNTAPTSKERPPLSDGLTGRRKNSGNAMSQSGATARSSQSRNIQPTKSHSSRPKPARALAKDIDARFFVRAVIRHADVFSSARDGAVVSMPEAERAFVEALDAVEMASCNRHFRRTDFNHIFLNVIPPVQIDVDDVEAICKRMFQRYAGRCWSLRVFAVEVKVPALVMENARPPSVVPLRFLLFNPTGHMLRVETYVESPDRNTGSEKLISVSPNNPGSLHGTLISQPYPIMDRVQRRRVVAQAMDTTYVYDFLQIFNSQLKRIWRRYSEDQLLGGFHRHKPPMTVMDATELVLCTSPSDPEDRQLEESSRSPGSNDIGMVAWHCVLRTPEYPVGREVIIVANDITFRSGSFGPDEDALFYEASRRARELGIPRIYIAANSGARIGVAEEVREKLQVDWMDPNNPMKGFKCLCLQEKDAEGMEVAVTADCSRNGLLPITDIIGSEHGIGVENLMGSGLIASETSRAYDETVTITFVSSRSVGIGAYLVRLGQRVIQKDVASPIILTGYSALNKVLGHDVYVSNEQLGGTKVMHPNGITHTVVPDDVGGVDAILDWLSYIPNRRGEPLPIIESRDPVSRPVHAKPPSDGQSYDPRSDLIGGKRDGGEGEVRFLGALFDKGSWREYLSGWAKTVIVGRARLGGVPVGVIATETRTVENVTPADPASPETRESVVMQAGQVWFPDSAAKTAQAIRDFDREELPLFILANWRGFSGGMRDMYDEILKSGSEIVDALRSYSNPVTVYIPPGGELRGGAWVVLDSLINPDVIEMYADSTSRGGVLEPEGIVDIKYRRRNILKTMHRLDPKLIELDRELEGGKQSGGILSEDKVEAIHEAISVRETEILPVYKHVATSFCDLHDTPGRLLAKGAIRRVIEWEESRSFFYWRLRRRIAECRVRKLCRDADPTLSGSKITGLLKKWAADYRMESGMNGHTPGGSNHTRENGEFSDSGDGWLFDEDDKWVFQWLEVEEDAIKRRTDKIRTARIAALVCELYNESFEGFVDGIESALRCCRSGPERMKLAGAIESKMTMSSSTRTVGSSPLSLLTRLGKLGWDREKTT